MSIKLNSVCYICDRETHTIICRCEGIREALNLVVDFENEDKRDNIYTEGYYIIVDGMYHPLVDYANGGIDESLYNYIYKEMEPDIMIECFKSVIRLYSDTVEELDDSFDDEPEVAEKDDIEYDPETVSKLIGKTEEVRKWLNRYFIKHGKEFEFTEFRKEV